MPRYKKEHIEIATRVMGRKPDSQLGSCFESCAIWMIDPRRMIPPDVVVVHGIGVSNFPGQEGMAIGHAWLEGTIDKRWAVIDVIWNIATTVENYYKQLQLSHMVVYPRKQFLKLWGETGFPGPWDKKIIDTVFAAADAIDKPKFPGGIYQCTVCGHEKFIITNTYPNKVWERCTDECSWSSAGERGPILPDKDGKPTGFCKRRFEISTKRFNSNESL